MNGIFEKIRKDHPQLDINLIERAYHFAKNAHEGQMRKSGEPFFMHPCEVASILLDMGMDTDTLAAAFLHDVIEDTEVTYEEIHSQFGENIALLVDGVTKLTRLQFNSREEQQAESLRKMLLAMAKDIRVVIIKLADRLHNMRTLKFRSEASRQAVARETMDIYAPLAHRLGIYTIKWELEDLSLLYLDPEGYKELVDKVAMKRKERENAIETIIESLRQRLAEHDIEATIVGRPKHFYSIYQKMTQQHKAFEEIYDLTAIRILVKTVRECYAVLGIVHTMWKPLPGRFKDYIAVPKPNLYQSLHTTLIGKQGIPFEIQIRTYEMHRTAEYGIAAHWKYKEQRDTDSDMDNKLTWLRQILEWQNETSDAQEFIDTLKIDLFSEEVFVFTPKGDVVDLPKGATPIDFAYHIHSAVGNRCIGAKINGRMVPLGTALKTGDIVEIITTKTGHGPSRDWLNIVRTPQARSKIRNWFKKEGREENIEKGRDILEAAAKRYGYKLPLLMRSEWLEPLYKRFSLNSQEDLYATVGYGGLSSGQVLFRLIEEYKKEQRAQETQPAEKAEDEKPAKEQKSASQGVIVKGEKNMLVRFAKCCNPLPQDPIVGFITRGRGVSIHRLDCVNIKDLDSDGRLIEVEWDRGIESSYNAELKMVAKDRPGLLVDVSSCIQQANSKIVAINARINKDRTVSINLVLQITTKQQLENLIKSLNKMPETIEVFRVNPSGNAQ